MASSRVFFTKSDGGRIGVRPGRVSHYHEYGELVKIHMDDGWVYSVIATFKEVESLIDPEPAGFQLETAA